jgi:SAM-dependent methyltransferase
LRQTTDRVGNPENRVRLVDTTTQPGILERSGCLVCGATLKVTLEELADTRFGSPGVYKICRCVRCGLEQTHPLPSLSALKSLYECHYNFGGEKGTAYTSLREWFLSSQLYRLWLAVDGDNAFYTRTGEGKLLDVGCNEGRGLRQYARNGFQAEGLDLNENAVRVAWDAGLTVYPVPLEDFQPPVPYDVVVLSNVLEHSVDPKGMLLDAGRVLKSGGQVWVSCPNSESWMRSLFGRSWINWHVPFHIVQFSRSSLQQLLANAGFDHVEFRQVTPAAWVASSLIVKIFFRDGKPTWQLRMPLLLAGLMLLIRTLFFPILWIANRLGKGDCLVATGIRASADEVR